MKLLDGIAEVINALRGPSRAETEAAYVSEFYKANAGALNRRLTWYRVVSERGNVVGAHFSCKCSAEYRLVSLNDLFKDYTCVQCGLSFSLLKAIGYTSKNTPQDLPRLMAALPIMPQAARSAESRVRDTWQDDGGDVFGYEPSNLKFT